ncbi:hypothetical protein [Acinetobacter baumannii]|uniref:hypothetical protein n=1 Tax=Acinetobacter baumannii TaxID=470 RepID=UPI002542DB32|nr:hypothetical protein [Acinetobacter baumannii]WIH75493.1 hypothetical protein M2A29_05580 [Acinetobacter baumannii]
MNTKTNLSQHPCENKCSKFNGEQCSTCLIQEVEKREFDLGLAPDAEYVKCQIAEGDFVVFTNDFRNDDVHQIDAFQPAEYYWLTTGEIVHKDNIRLATPIEIETKQRTSVDVLKHFKRAQKSQGEVS